ASTSGGFPGGTHATERTTMSNQPPSTPFAQTNGTHRHFRAADENGRYARADSPEDVSDELAALFLGGLDDHAGPPREVPSTQAELKPVGGSRKPPPSLLVLGNLPVVAAAWAGQYARDRQSAMGRPLGLLSLGEEAARLEVFGAANDRPDRGTDLGRALADLARMNADLVVR